MKARLADVLIVAGVALMTFGFLLNLSAWASLADTSAAQKEREWRSARCATHCGEGVSWDATSSSCTCGVVEPAPEHHHGHGVKP